MRVGWGSAGKQEEAILFIIRITISVEEHHPRKGEPKADPGSPHPESEASACTVTPRNRLADAREVFHDGDSIARDNILCIALMKGGRRTKGGRGHPGSHGSFLAKFYFVAAARGG